MDKLRHTAVYSGAASMGSIGKVKRQKDKVKPPPVDVKKEKPVTDKVDISTLRDLAKTKSKKPHPEAPSDPLMAKSGIDPSLMKQYPKTTYKITPNASEVTFVYDAENRENLNNLTLVGSWDKNTGKYTNAWDKSQVKMVKDEHGRWSATIPLIGDGKHDWEWGVKADSPIGKQTWAVFEEGNLKVKPKACEKVRAEYAPTTRTRMGATRQDEDINFKYWAPNAKDVKVRLWDDNPRDAALVDLSKDPKTGMWIGGIEGGWKAAEGKVYAMQITTSEGKEVLRTDPYARYQQGQQKGMAELYLHPENGMEVHQYYKDPALEDQGKPSWKRFMRFEIQQHENADAAYLKLYDEKGNQMNKKQLMDRIGDEDSELVKKFHNGQRTDYWADNVDESGTIKMSNQGGAWMSILSNPDALPGLSYKFEVHEKGPDGKTKIIGDANQDGVLSFREAKATDYNDAYSPVVIDKFGWQRFGLVKESNHVWKNDDVPRMAKDKKDMVIYQLHVGSVFGKAGNARRSTFKDVIKRLNYFKETGANTIEILPTNTFEGLRDWGYIGTSSMAQSEQYGFTDEKGKWVHGPDAVKKFVDAAHGMGFRVINDVVYNHWGGDHNQLWKHDGVNNPYFDWDEKPQPPVKENDPEVMGWVMKDPVNLEGVDKAEEALAAKENPEMDGWFVQEPLLEKSPDKFELREKPRSEVTGRGVKHTDWGAMPAYNKDSVRNLITDHAMEQLDEYHFDGLRFDFTHPIHNQDWGGGDEGWTLLRRVNRQIHYFHPDTVTAAEEFPNTEPITKPAGANGEGGAGFDQMWNTEFQHRLVHDPGRPGLLQSAAHNWRTNIDDFMHHLTNHPGFTSDMNSTTVITNHDEVGNADRTINTAMNHQHGKTPNQWEKNVARLTFGTGMLAPGTPIYFQGEESLANNVFKWGTPTTWDNGWEWQDVGKDVDWSQVKMDDNKANEFKELADNPDRGKIDRMPENDRKLFDYVASKRPEERDQAIYNIYRKQHHLFSKEVTNLRNSSIAFDGDSPAHRVYTHNDDSVFAFSRSKGDDEFLVIGSFNKENKQDYNIPLKDGKWKLVFNSDAKMFGGQDFGSKFEVYGHGDTRFDIPKGGMLVYKRVE